MHLIPMFIIPLYPQLCTAVYKLSHFIIIRRLLVSFQQLLRMAECSLYIQFYRLSFIDYHRQADRAASSLQHVPLSMNSQPTRNKEHLFALFRFLPPIRKESSVLSIMKCHSSVKFTSLRNL